jgi:Fe-S cluster biogenesis protein NfuA
LTKRDEFREKAKSIENLIRTLEEGSDPPLRAAAKTLVQAIMELHGSGLERMLEIVEETGDPGIGVIERFSRDELVASLLLLYGLHPESMRTRVARALETQRAFLKSHNAVAELVSISEAGDVTVHFQVRAGGCGSAAPSLQATLEAALQDAAPDASVIVVTNTSSAHSGDSGFISIAELQSGRAVSDATRVQRSEAR